jgi:hypothetical protein
MGDKKDFRAAGTRLKISGCLTTVSQQNFTFPHFSYIFTVSVFLHIIEKFAFGRKCR